MVLALPIDRVADAWQRRERLIHGHVGTSMKAKASARPQGNRRRSRAETRARKAAPHRWSAHVMKTSNALDLEPGVFTQRSAHGIAASLKRSALASNRRKSEPYRSAMSMLNFHINRSGHGLTPQRRRVLERAKVELRRLFGRPG
jgi:hypothetical protein